MSEVLAADGLTKRFGALLASDGVSIDVRAGEIHAVIGPNGAGKSTLIAQISGALAPDAGTVRLNGADVTRWSVARRAKAGLARTFQVSALALEATAEENVMLGALGRDGGLRHRTARNAALRDAARAALDRVGLAARGTPASDLSHGQRRQLEVAVALAQRPRLFLMDEPMAGLGAEGTRRLTPLLDGLRAEAPILLVEHDMDAVFALADRITVLVAGRAIATGTPSAIRADADVRAAYLGDG
ncbi:ABC transporter ATP-binding protein [Jannaschia sp. Os4]|uniref:ABC transporter ATP-binding protein n=1 Tax=Jannaschia sp. Os4 TaxID=2807617 RepID=UPI00193A2302|nr:ABC transporter ATP-binding protein [Jannaschia sp. Os4]MBM2577928.1 ABC transporter ATP-binding protein [Jannaschia sp. Os4]